MVPEDIVCDMKPALEANPVEITDFGRCCDEVLKR